MCRIFALAASGMSLTAICRLLNAEGVPTPSAYQHARGRLPASRRVSSRIQGLSTPPESEQQRREQQQAFHRWAEDAIAGLSHASIEEKRQALYWLGVEVRQTRISHQEPDYELVLTWRDLNAGKPLVLREKNATPSASVDGSPSAVGSGGRSEPCIYSLCLEEGNALPGRPTTTIVQTVRGSAGAGKSPPQMDVPGICSSGAGCSIQSEAIISSPSGPGRLPR